MVAFSSRLLASAALACIVSASAASAQPELDPGRFEQRFDIQDRPDVGTDTLVPADQAPTLSEDQAGPAFTLSGVTVQGSTVFSDAELSALYQSHIGTSVTLGDVRAVANAITAHYRAAGYVLSRAIVPPQRVNGGAVTIQVIEGYVDAVNFEGGEALDANLLAAYGANITAERPITNATLERYLLLVDDLTGVEARGVLSPASDAVGASQLTVVLDYDPVDGEVFINNRGSRFLGPLQMGATVGANSVLGLSERIQLRSIVSGNLDELRYYEASYQQPVWDEGTTLRGLVSFTDTEPGASLEPLDIEGESVNFTLAARHPLLRSRQENLFGNLGFRYRNSDSQLGLFSTELYDDHVRSIYGGVNYDAIDSWEGINRIDAELTQGLDILDGNDAGDFLSRANAESSFTKIELQYSRLQPFTANISGYVSLAGQYAFDPLFASEEFGIGSEPFGSAYDPSEITGDHGVAARMELRYSDTLPDTIVDVWQVYGFYDGGKVYNRDTIAGERRHESLTSAGVGARLNLTNNVSATAEIAAPLTRDVSAEGSDGDDIRGFFSLVYGF